jgi:hypothetical protein
LAHKLISDEFFERGPIPGCSVFGFEQLHQRVAFSVILLTAILKFSATGVSGVFKVLSFQRKSHDPNCLQSPSDLSSA